MILEKVSAKRSWKRHIFPHMEAEKQSDFGKHHSHRWEQKSKVTLEKVTAKEPWKRHGRNAMGCIFKPKDSSLQPMAIGTSFGKDLWAA